jgi:hypothetical protein
MMQNFQKDVPILVFEDQYIFDGTEMTRYLGLPTSRKAGGQQYTFDWHPVYNAVGGNTSGVLVRTLEQYRAAFDFLRNKLRDEAIIFMDLQLYNPDDGRKFLIEPNEITDDLFAFMNCYASGPKQGLEFFNPNRVGLLLAFAAAMNQRWQGVISFQSSQQLVDLELLRSCLDTGDRIQWLDPRLNLKGGNALETRAGTVIAAIDAFLDQRAGPPFWPAFTSHWFSDHTAQPTHDTSSLDSEGVNKIGEYVSQLLSGIDLPEAWLKNPQLTSLHNVLKGLIGANSVSAGYTAKNRKNLRLGALPLLLAAQMAWKGADISWLGSFEWDPAAAYTIMNHDVTGEARTAVRTAASFLELLAYNPDGSSQVISAHWGRVENDEATHLWIDFDLDPLSPAGTRSLLQTLFGERWGNDPGQTIKAYVDMMESARTIGGRTERPSFSLCIYPVVCADSKKTITRLDFKAL